MAPITIDTKDIVKWIGFVIIGIILIVVGGFAALFVFSPGLHPGTAVSTPTVVTPVPTPTPVVYQTTNSVTISSMTTSAGFPQVNIKEDTRVFRVDWNTYDYLRVDDVVRFVITGTEPMYGGTVYDVKVDSYIRRYDDNYYNTDFPIIYGPSVVSSSNYDYPIYYYDPSTRSAWQWDGRHADSINVKELRGERVIRGRPPSNR